MSDITIRGYKFSSGTGDNYTGRITHSRADINEKLKSSFWIKNREGGYTRFRSVHGRIIEKEHFNSFNQLVADMEWSRSHGL